MDKIAEKAVLIGIDSITPELTERFIDEEKLPNWQGLVEDGVFGEGIPPLPSLTGSNWKTIVTGAYPGTIGVTGCWFHISGTPLDQLVNGFISNFTKAECLWTTAERHKLKPLIMKYAGALGTAKKPFAVERGIQVEGFASPMWGGNWFEICPCLLYSTESYRDAVQVQFQKTSDWKNLPESTRTPLETTIKVKPKRGEAEVKFNLLIIDSKGDGYDRVVISPSRNIKEAIGNVGVGEWTDWLTEKFEGRILQGPPVRAHQVPNSGFRWDYDPEYTRQYKEIEGTFRFKLIELSPDGKRLRLYRSQVFPKSGFTKPDSLAEKLVEKFGPFQEHIGPKPIYEGWIDEETFLEEMDYQSRWLGKATDYIFSHYDWHLYFLQWHGPNHAQHTFWGGIDPVSPWYDETKAEKYWNIFRRFYGMADTMTGEITENIGEDTLIVIVADHGHVPIARGTVFIGNAFVQAGLMSLKKTEKGDLIVDWSKTKAVPLGLDHVWVNLKERDATGIVEAGDEYEEIRDTVINLLYSLEDPKGRHPISFAFRREDGEALGHYGDRVGDVVFQLVGGYMGSVNTFTEDLNVFPEGLYGESMSDDSRGGHGLTRGPSSEHGYYFPTTRFGLGSIRVPFIMAGPGVKKGYRLKKPIRLVDIAPTISHLLGISAPADSEGTIIREALV